MSLRCIHPYRMADVPQQYVVVTLERRDLLSLADAEAVARLARHQGATVAVVPADQVMVLADEEG